MHLRVGLRGNPDFTRERDSEVFPADAEIAVKRGDFDAAVRRFDLLRGGRHARWHG